MTHIHHPVVGDPVYGGRARHPKDMSNETVTKLKAFPRQALHAWRLQLTHPKSSKQMTWTADLPDDMKSLLLLLRNESPE